MLKKVNQMRINKFIAESGITSRRKAEELILQGRVEVNGIPVLALSFAIKPEKDIVTLDGEVIKPQRYQYFLLNKPKGTITSTADEKRRKTVTELIKASVRIFPIGRLDYNTTGVILLTNDGDFANYLMHPSNNIQREYVAQLDHSVSLEHESEFLRGIFIEGVRGKFEKIEYLDKIKRMVKVTSTEGRNHFVKKMFKELGYTVLDLTRIRFGSFTAEDLAPGEYRKLTQDEVNAIRKRFKK